MIIGIGSPTTAIGRANALLRYLRWAMNMLDDIFLAFREESVWNFFAYLKYSGSAATTAGGLLSAMRFAKFVMGSGSLDEILASNRIKRSADLMYVGKEASEDSFCQAGGAVAPHPSEWRFCGF